MRRVSGQIIAASPNDLKNNRLGLMSQGQVVTLEEQIDHFQARMSQLTRRAVKLAIAITIVVVALTFLRALALPVALAIEVAVVGVMLYLTADYNRFRAAAHAGSRGGSGANCQGAHKPLYPAHTSPLSFAAH